MFLYFKKIYFQLEVKLLIIFRPDVLFDRINRLNWYQSALRQWVDDQRFATQNEVLEVGCATGELTAYIANSGCIPTGVDASDKMIEFAKNNNKDIDFAVANALELPFKRDRFDGVIAASLVNIVPEKSKVIAELSRTCKKGGRVTILVPSEGFQDVDLHSLQDTLGNSGFSYAALEAWHHRAPKMDATAVIELFEQSGLTKIIKKDYLKGMVISISAIKL